MGLVMKLITFSLILHYSLLKIDNHQNLEKMVLHGECPMMNFNGKFLH
ncbi:hypothetical protein GLYMA_08G339850v4 [Glycine max]|nr:hypothetical protein GLYMA_08G339850v4 [Glycine max]KAH1054429.1 hypothetical protein GYH30_023278 [Glycine max]